jgi:hypothetical protein
MVYTRSNSDPYSMRWSRPNCRDPRSALVSSTCCSSRQIRNPSGTHPALLQGQRPGECDFLPDQIQPWTEWRRGTPARVRTATRQAIRKTAQVSYVGRCRPGEICRGKFGLLAPRGLSDPREEDAQVPLERIAESKGAPWEVEDAVVGSKGDVAGLAGASAGVFGGSFCRGRRPSRGAVRCGPVGVAGMLACSAGRRGAGRSPVQVWGRPCRVKRGHLRGQTDGGQDLLDGGVGLDQGYEAQIAPAARADDVDGEGATE